VCISYLVSSYCFPSLQKSGSITYNGYEIDEFYVRRTSAYISQTDNHIPELTVRETLDFGARCQGAEEGFAGIHYYAKEGYIFFIICFLPKCI
jgi:ABC-type multidrug transport system ATPase subunit